MYVKYVNYTIVSSCTSTYVCVCLGSHDELQLTSCKYMIYMMIVQLVSIQSCRPVCIKFFTAGEFIQGNSSLDELLSLAF